ncbi:Gfo/Idh/MocA family oxidoreductase [Candidatus Poribacteria bacterium]|nr:Gfo/Idh/MocA family oxidoreductase [Candidatus Poribacteria bacterium]
MLRYGFEHPAEEKVRAGFVGCGGHSFRNVYPCLRYAPVDLVAVCDLDEARANAYAREFGAARAYTDVDLMLAHEELDAVFVVTNYDADGLPRFPAIAIPAMQAGAHVWIEKPPAGTSADIEAMIRVSQETGKFVQVGYKKMFTPANSKLREISRSESFGAITSIAARYPQGLPDMDRRTDSKAMVGFLDHIHHPGSVLQLLAGPARTLYYERARNGATVATLTFGDGIVGNLHLTAGQSGTSPLERTEIIGEGANAVVENGVRLTYYRRGGRGPGGYGRSPDFIGDEASAPLVWEPEFSLGQLYNKGLFLMGYAPEITAFVESARHNRPPEKANLADALAITRLYEAYRYHPAGEVIPVNPRTEGA